MSKMVILYASLPPNFSTDGSIVLETPMEIELGPKSALIANPHTLLFNRALYTVCTLENLKELDRFPLFARIRVASVLPSTAQERQASKSPHPPCAYVLVPHRRNSPCRIEKLQT